MPFEKSSLYLNVTDTYFIYMYVYIIKQRRVYVQHCTKPIVSILWSLQSNDQVQSIQSSDSFHENKYYLGTTCSVQKTTPISKKELETTNTPTGQVFDNMFSGLHTNIPIQHTDINHIHPRNYSRIILNNGVHVRETIVQSL